MNSIVIRLFVLVCTFGAALLGMLLRAFLPERHLSGDSKETVTMFNAHSRPRRPAWLLILENCAG